MTFNASKGSFRALEPEANQPLAASTLRMRAGRAAPGAREAGPTSPNPLYRGDNPRKPWVDPS